VNGTPAIPRLPRGVASRVRIIGALGVLTPPQREAPRRSPAHLPGAEDRISHTALSTVAET
jgi:hypothetical protein